ncbi:MAG: recombination mediator RecR [Candidatus Omnitrophica bacterium]|nr:recombination mediator RecR [Candidatus Omnitrophota bacterium]
MANFPPTLENLIKELVKMPGIGRRSAQRIAFYILHSVRPEVKRLVSAIIRAKESICFCKVCNNLSDKEICSICQDPARIKTGLCIVEGPNDVAVIENAGTFKGRYHVLLGSIAPLEGKGPEDLKIDDLLQRIKQEGINELIIATDADTEGETTALYLTKFLKPTGVKITRIGLGIPMGGNIEYADSHTISQALEHRKEICSERA